MSKSKIGALFPDKKSATSAESATSAKKANVPEGFKKHGVEIRTEYLERLKDAAWRQRKRLRDVLDDALRIYLESQG